MSAEPLLVHHLLDGTDAGDKPAIIDGERSLGFDELRRRARDYAAAFRRAGVLPGDRVAILLPKCLEECCAIFGSSLADAVFVPINPLLKPIQVAHIVADAEARIVVTNRALAPLLADARARAAGPDGGAGRGDRRDRWRAAAPHGDRRGPRRHSLHLGLHRQTQGGDAEPSQPRGRLPDRPHLSGHHRRRSHPLGAALQLRLWAQPVADRGGAAGDASAADLPAGRRHRPRHRPARHYRARRRADGLGDSHSRRAAPRPHPADDAALRHQFGRRRADRNAAPAARAPARHAGVPDVRAHRGIPLHFPAARGTRPPAQLDRPRHPRDRGVSR
jgi:acyl-CoA synthetase (AMP-forming)/AMP-acid ligase II